MIYRFTTATLLAQGAAAGRQLMECSTGQVATCFNLIEDGGDIDLNPSGTMSSWDGITSNAQLTLKNKYASIACIEGMCLWVNTTGKGVVLIKDNGGTSTLEKLTIKDGTTFYGGGLSVKNANAVLILVAFIDNASSGYGGAISVNTYGGGSSAATLQGCSFSGNTASDGGPDVYNYGQTVVISGCPAGEDKATRP